MDDVVGERRSKGDAFLAPPPSSASFPALSALTPRGPGLLSSPSGSNSSLLPSPPPAAAAIVLALPSVPASTLLAGAMDAGEPLLVRRTKPKKRSAPHAHGTEFGAGDRSLALWRRYHDLLRDMDAKKRRLESARRRKLRLLAEVKFLRRKYKSLVKNSSQQPNYKLKGQDRQIQAPVGINEASAFAGHDVRTGVSSTSKNTNLHLNQDTVMNYEGSHRRGHQNYPEHGNLDQENGVDEDMINTDVKFSVCSRDTGNSPSSDDKRTISWQDRLALQT